MFFFSNCESCSLFFLFNPQNFLNCKVTALIFSFALISYWFQHTDSLFCHRCVSWHAFYSSFSKSSDLLIPASSWFPALTILAEQGRSQSLTVIHYKAETSSRWLDGCLSEVQYSWQTSSAKALFIRPVWALLGTGVLGSFWEGSLESTW